MRGPWRAGAALAWCLAAPSLTSGAEETIALVVTDAGGTPVVDLRRDEVRIVENGESRVLVSVGRDERPLEIALVLDSSDVAMGRYLSSAYSDVRDFVHALPADARCVLWGTADRPRRIAELGDPGAIETAVGQAFGTRGTSTLLDALVEASADLERSEGRRRALVVVAARSPGHSSWEPPQILEKIRRARVPVLAVQYGPAGGGGGGVAGMMRDSSSFTLLMPQDHERILTTLARRTGGRFEAVAATGAVHALLQSFARELQGAYRVRYRSVPAREGRQVQVRVGRDGVRWRVTVDSP